MLTLAAALALSLGAVREVPAGAPLAPALAAARPGDVIRLGPGRHAGALGGPAELRIEGAGAGVTRVVAPPGEDGAVVRGRVTLAGLSLEAGPGRAALKVLGGDVRLEDVVLAGGSCGAFVDGGRLTARRVSLAGGYGLLVGDGEVVVEEADTRGTIAGVAALAGTVTLRRSSITGPSREAGVTVARGTARLEAVVIRAPGPSGLAVSHGGTIEGHAVVVAGAVEVGGILGACAEVLRGTLRLDDAALVGCAGAAVEASGGEVELRAVDAAGGAAGCLVLVNGTTARLEGNVCTGRGPGLVVAGASRAILVANRWRTDPAAWVDCAGGARVEIGRGETLGPQCARP
jgi:hypothetical protein